MVVSVSNSKGDRRERGRKTARRKGYVQTRKSDSVSDTLDEDTGSTEGRGGDVGSSRLRRKGSQFCL
jgi:hypothetical protein